MTSSPQSTGSSRIISVGEQEQGRAEGSPEVRYPESSEDLQINKSKEGISISIPSDGKAAVNAGSQKKQNKAKKKTHKNNETSTVSSVPDDSHTKESWNG